MRSGERLLGTPSTGLLFVVVGVGFRAFPPPTAGFSSTRGVMVDGTVPRKFSPTRRNLENRCEPVGNVLVDRTWWTLGLRQ